MGSAAGALAPVDWLASFDPGIVVPGHSPLLTGPDIERVFDEHRRCYASSSTSCLPLTDEFRASGNGFLINVASMAA